MNVEIGAEAAQFPEKEYINGIAVAVQVAHCPEFLTCMAERSIFIGWQSIDYLSF
jgi:hypothetical protein